MLKVFFFTLLILFVISIILIIHIKYMKQVSRIYSIQTFLGNSSTELEEVANEQKKSFIDAINDFFKVSNDEIIDDDGDDAGE